MLTTNFSSTLRLSQHAINLSDLDLLMTRNNLKLADLKVQLKRAQEHCDTAYVTYFYAFYEKARQQMQTCQTDIMETKNLLRGLHMLFWQHKSSQSLAHNTSNHRNTVNGKPNISSDDSRQSLLSTSLALQGEDTVISDLSRFKVIISICTLFSAIVDALHQVYNDDETIEEEASLYSQSALSARSAQEDPVTIVSSFK